MKRGIVLGLLLTAGALSLWAAGFQNPPAAGQRRGGGGGQQAPQAQMRQAEYGTLQCRESLLGSHCHGSYEVCSQTVIRRRGA